MSAGSELKYQHRRTDITSVTSMEEVPDPRHDGHRGVSLLTSNRALLDELVALARRAAASGDAESAAVLAQIAGHHSWCNHPGMLYDDRLEQILWSLAATDKPARAPSRRDGWDAAGRRVLHVLTEAYEIGGHTRLAWRWIDRDDASSSSVVLTQHTQAIPAPLVGGVRRRGGRVYQLARATSSLTQRAQLLRRLAVQFDFVVLHIHPYDVVPTLAFAHCDSTPPVILENHADHCFWLGLSVANLLTDHRESAQRITAERRGVPPSHMGWLPLPIEVLQAGPSRAEARQALGIPDDMVLGVSIANAFKSQPLRGPGLAEALIPVAAQHPNFTAMVVGPSPKDSRWQAAQRETGNRVRALGVVTDPQNLVRAADIYLDSSPVGSGTSILEAALASLPPVSLFRFEGHARIFGSNSPGLAQGHTTVTTIEDYVDVLGQLICDPTERRRRGTLVSQSVQHVHCGDEWRHALEAVYEQALDLRPIGLAPDPHASYETDDFDQLLVEYHQLGGVSMSFADVLSQQLSILNDGVAHAMTDANPSLAGELSLALRKSQRQRDSAVGPAAVTPPFRPAMGSSARYVIWVVPAGASDCKTAFDQVMSVLCPADVLHVVEVGASLGELTSLLSLATRIGRVRFDLAAGPNWPVRVSELVMVSPLDAVLLLVGTGITRPGRLSGLLATPEHRVGVTVSVPWDTCDDDRAMLLTGLEACRRSGILPVLDESLDCWLERLDSRGYLYCEEGEFNPEFVPAMFACRGIGPNRQGLCLVAPPGWQTNPGWLAATVNAAIDCASAERKLRLVLPITATTTDLVGAALREAAEVLHDLGLDPDDLPFEIAIGDDLDVSAPDYPWKRVNLPAAQAPSHDWLSRRLGISPRWPALAAPVTAQQQ